MIESGLKEKVQRCYVADGIGDLLKEYPVVALTVAQLAVLHSVNEMTIQRRLTRIINSEFYATLKIGSCYLFAVDEDDIQHNIGFVIDTGSEEKGE